jgi:signal transduction histidine kinase
MHVAKSKSERLSAPVISYVAGVVFLAVVTGALVLAAAPLGKPLTILLWAGAFLAGELMVFKTPTGRVAVSMAATMHLASLPLVGPAILLPAVWISRLTANLIIQQKPWYKALFNAAQVSLVVLAARFCYGLFGGTYSAVWDQSTLLDLAPALAAAAVSYYLINTAFVSGVLALSTRTGYWVTWRENYGYRVEVVSSAALFLLAPVATHAYQDMGGFGLAIFLLPMWFIRDACHSYIVLERTQRALIGSERLAAKGEIAAAVGHELNNYLAVVHGNLQLLDLGAAKLPEKAKERLYKIGDQIKRMTTLSKGLMQFSHLESRMMPTDVGGLVKETVEFLRPQNRFDNVIFDLECDPRAGVVTVDPAQIQQILMNLFNNAADAMNEVQSAKRHLSVWLRWRSSEGLLELGVQDSGPGVPEDLRRRIFEPNFTTKETGHGFGLSTVFRIVSNHNGTIAVEDASEGGALFRILLPTTSKAPRPLAAA